MPPLLAAHDVPASAVAGAWHLHPAPVVFALVATAVFAPAFARVRRRDPGQAPWSRAVVFACGLAVMAVPLVSPLNVAGQLLSDALVFSFHAYYPAYADRPGRLFGISPLTDQRLAGIVMAAEQLLTLGTCFVVLLLQLRRSSGVRHSAVTNV